MYLAVLPAYRTACMELVREHFGPHLRVFVSEAHLDATVTTDSTVRWYERVTMHRFLGKRLFLQVGHIPQAFRAESLIVDLNPRSGSAWILLVARRLARKPTVVWGHLYPQLGRGAKSGGLRSAMRRLASGTISYTYTNKQQAEHDMPGSRVWVAPNSLYPKAEIHPGNEPHDRNAVIYVGRFVAGKKVDVLIRGFAKASTANPDIVLTLIGDGPELKNLMALASALEVEDKVTFLGWVSEAGQLRSAYDTAFCSVSPGFAGLGLTQSAGFGVPMIISQHEQHSPEIELLSSDAGRWFETGVAESLATAITDQYRLRHELPNEELSTKVRETYSAEAMAQGLISALSAFGDSSRNEKHD
jgi:glycosyltransferase involved in cell wall biosynthesis